MRYFAIAVAAVLITCSHALAQERRIALVIGNGKYANAPHLTNPAEDAQALVGSLKRLGFEVQQAIDADRSAMERAIRDFGDRAKAAEVALFYFAGHAFQVADRNLLIPTNASIGEERDLKFETLDLEDVLAQVSGRTKINIVLVDACRDNPFARRLNTGTRGVRATLGPAPVSTSAGTFIAFATAPGTVAEDGAGRNSPFTAAILQQIETPGLEVRQMMGRVRQSVRETTQGRQIPWESSSLEGSFYFRPPEPERPKQDTGAPAASANRDADLMFWEAIKNSRDGSEYQAYVERFPSGVFAPLARVRLQQFAMLAPSAEPGPGIVPTSDAITTVELTALRTDPSAAAEVLGHLEPWTHLQATGRTRDGKWLRVRSQDVEAYLPAASVKRREVAQADEWRRAEAANTIDAYAQYLERFPRDENTQLAGRRIDELRTAQAGNSTGGEPPQVTAEKFDPARVPFVKAADRNRLKLYASVKREKALALSDSGELAWATQMGSLNEAERIALERCEYLARRPCSVYARNDEVRTPADGEWKPEKRLNASLEGRFSPQAVPFVTDSDQRKLQTYAEARSAKALALHPDGRHASATGLSSDHEAQQQALSRCQGAGRDPCVLFAANDVVVLEKRASRPLAEATVSPASVPLAAPSQPYRQGPARSLAYDGVWRLRVSCGPRDEAVFDITVLNAIVSFGQNVKFGGSGSGKAYLSGNIRGDGTGVLTGSRFVEARRSVPAYTEMLSLHLTFIGAQANGFASVGPKGPCPITGSRR